MVAEKPVQFKIFDLALEAFRDSLGLSRKEKIKDLVNAADDLASTKVGLKYLYQNILDIEKAGLFIGTAWSDANKLVPSLVKGTLQFGHPTATVELLSELRMLAYANSLDPYESVSKNDALEYITKVLILNLEFALNEPSEESRVRMNKKELQKAYLLFTFILSKVKIKDIQDMLAEEIELICIQRSVVTKRVRELLALISREIGLDFTSESGKILSTYLRSIKAPSEGAQKHPELNDYASFLNKASRSTLQKEAAYMGNYMEMTGLVSQHHALLLLHLTKKSKSLVPSCLALTESGIAEWEKHKKLYITLIQENISEYNCQSIYGLSSMINRTLFSDNTVRMAFENLRHIKIHEEVENRILKSIPLKIKKVTALQRLIGATFRVLGQPLGVGQGNNPTCQSARAISMWSQHAPARLINFIISAATQNKLIFRFENQEIDSTHLDKGLVDQLDYNLDAVSIVLVPHLDKIYSEMMKRCMGRSEDPHKWVNPALYGGWIQIGFASAYDYLSNTILDYHGFLRTFYASFHLKYNGNQKIVFPVPVGIYLTSAKGDFVGFHAISLLRSDYDETGELRLYFHNPNNEGRQNWGQGILPSVHGHGEAHGECSLPFHQFAARIYAFHYTLIENNHLKELVPKEEILTVEELSRSSWGRSYVWNQQPKIWNSRNIDAGANYA